MEITFSNPEYFWLLLGVPLLIILHFFSVRYINNKTIKFANFEALERVVGGMVLSRNVFLLLLRLFALLFLTLSLAGATMWYVGQSDVSDYVFAIDNSGSMLADDFDPNRLEAAKEATLIFIENLEAESRIGIVSFSGIGLVELPLTRERWKIKQAIEGIEISSIHGTAIGDALKTSANLFSGSNKSRTIILLTDGQENVASDEVLGKIIEFVNNKQIIVNTIGVATEIGGTLPGIKTVSTLDEKTLSFVAESTGGSYVHSGNKEDLVEAYKSFEYESVESKIPIHMRLPSILIALLILFIEWNLINTRYRTIP